MRLQLAAIAAPFLLLAPTLGAQPVDTARCSTMAVDAIPENGFTIGSGQSLLEICSLGVVPEVSDGENCTWGDRYHAHELTGYWTALTPLPPVGAGFHIRPEVGGQPGPAIDPQPLPGTIPSPPIFPSAVQSVDRPYQPLTPSQRLRDRWLIRSHLTYSCWELPPESQGRFLAVDRSSSTPATPCLVRENGAPSWEPCTAQDPQLKAVGVGIRAAPIAGFATSREIAPPIPKLGFTGSIATYYDGGALPADPPPGNNTFHFQIVHDVPDPIAVHLHEGYPFQNGLIVVDFPDPTSPIDLSGVVLTPAQIAALGANRLYIDVHSADFPDGAIRGQLIPAQPGIFADGFESGDTSAWSATTP